MAIFNSYVESSEGKYRYISLRNIPVLAEPRCVVTPFFADEISVNPRIDEIFFGCSSFVSWTQSDHTFPIDWHLSLNEGSLNSISTYQFNLIINYLDSSFTFNFILYHPIVRIEFRLDSSGIAAPPVEDFYEELRCLALNIIPLLLPKR